MSENYITDEIRALIGSRTEPTVALHAVEESEVRRFFQAVMDPAPRYYDAEWAKDSRYGGTVAPPAFPVHGFRRHPTVADPLEAMGEQNFDGIRRSFRPGLPSIEVPLKKLLNGGYEYEFFRYARIGERLTLTSRLADIYQRDGKSGPMVFVVIDDIYANERGETLVRATNTLILR